MMCKCRIHALILIANKLIAEASIDALMLQAENMGVHPFYLMFPVTVSASMAFMLPVATPPNAIVFAYGNTRIIDMVRRRRRRRPIASRSDVSCDVAKRYIQSFERVVFRGRAA